jgi:type VI secretion system protein ImpA
LEFWAMGSIDLEQLLSPISGAEPSGANLEYDPAFGALEKAAQGKPEQRMGESIVPSEPPDWSSVQEQCLELFGRTRDLRVAVHLTNALLERSGYPGFGEGLAVVHGLLSRFWPTVHPELDHEDADDPTMRITALSALAAPALLLRLRSAPIVQARALGVVTLRDVQALSGQVPVAGSVPTLDPATIEAVFQEVELGALEAVAAALGQCSASLAGIDMVFETNTGGHGPDLTELSRLVREASKAVAPRLEARRAAARPVDAEAENEVSPGHGDRGGTLSGEIRSREDVVRAIDKINAYYARFEPTSPLPLLLERCKRLVGSSFLEIIRDVAPESLKQVEGLSGRKPE